MRRSFRSHSQGHALAELNITLPPVAAPAAAYVPFVQTGNLVFLSGHIAKKDGKVWVGQFGKTMTTAEGQAANLQEVPSRHPVA